jgi:hypothetical protein
MTGAGSGVMPTSMVTICPEPMRIGGPIGSPLTRMQTRTIFSAMTWKALFTPRSGVLHRVSPHLLPFTVAHIRRLGYQPAAGR